MTIITPEMQIEINKLKAKGIALGWSNDERRISLEARRIVCGGKLDRTSIAMFGLNAKPDADTSINACPRCGGLGKGNWGSVVDGICYRCKGTGKR